jgi:AcrR family transcriptional regulator
LRFCSDITTFSDVPSENDAPTQTLTHQSAPDRRTRKRDARRDHLLDLAAEIVDQAGVDGLTMAALAQAADYATASLYTYFNSRSALLAALQQRALLLLHDLAEERLAQWQAALRIAKPPPTDQVASLAMLWAFSDLFLSAPQTHPREFRLQQQLLVNAGAENTADAAGVVPVAMLVLDVPRRLLAAATMSGALHEQPLTSNPLEEVLEGSMLRTFAWVLGLNGALMADGLSTGLPTTGAALGEVLTQGLLQGWGASPNDSAIARSVAETLREQP